MKYQRMQQYDCETYGEGGEDDDDDVDDDEE